MKIFNFEILPKEDKFYHYFESLSLHCVTSAELIQQLVQLPQGMDTTDLSNRLTDLKKTSKSQYEELSAALCRSFITPFDREDLLSLGSYIYRGIKLSEKIKRRAILNHISLNHATFRQLSDVVHQEAQTLHTLILALNRTDLTGVESANRRLHELEDQGDILLEEGMKHLFDPLLSTPEILVLKDLYKMFEFLTDLYRDCGTLALNIILKHT